jgi:Na+-transporting NADH:ubiquinone oxidoreductase subunit D
LLGSGKLFGFDVFSAIGWSSFPTNGLMVTPVGAFIILGLIIWVQRSKSGYVEQH